MRVSRRGARRRLGAGRAGILSLALLTLPSPTFGEAPGAATDPPAALLAVHRAETPAEALAALVSADAGVLPPTRLAYVQATLLERAGHLHDAKAAFGRAMSPDSPLRQLSRFHLARLEARIGHPEVAAGIVASLVEGVSDPLLSSRAAELLRVSIAEGGDCRLLSGLDPTSLDERAAREVRLATGICAAREGRSRTSRRVLLSLLEDKLTDDVAYDAALRLHTGPTTPSRSERTLIGAALHQHRDFDAAIDELGSVVAALPPRPTRSPNDPDDGIDSLYLLARSHFWRQEHRRAADLFGDLAARHPDGGLRARALYQRGRSLELAGNRSAALASFMEAAEGGRDSEWVAPALRAALRLHWISGRQTAAIEIFERLLGRPAWSDHAARAALFLSSSDLVTRRSDRAGEWLDAAEVSAGTGLVEIDYWRGRLAELEGALDRAVAHYGDVLIRRPDHPLAVSARERLARPMLEEARRSAIRRAMSSSSTGARIRAWCLLAEDEVGFESVRRAVRREASRLAPAYVALEPVGPSRWPLWREPDDSAESILLQLGAWGDVRTRAILDRFPVDKPALAVTAARRLQQLGEIRRGISVAEITAGAAPDLLPYGLLSPVLRRALYPAVHTPIVDRWTRSAGADPYLLLAIAREESRFDPRALSAASARGLTQFVMPTARRLAARIGRPDLVADDLYEPEVALALGATYVGDLKREFDGRRHEMIAAYNAGEPQARLWRDYCESADPAEYVTKIGFRQTRAYVARVLTSWERYRELYPVLPERPG